MIEFVIVILISLFFLTLMIWIVTKEAINRRSYSFKLKSVLVIYITPTIVILFLFIIDESLLFILVGYSIGVVITEYINQTYFDKQVIKKLHIASRVPLEEPEETKKRLQRERVQNDGEKTS